MERIELSPLDKKDLLELLDYIKDVKKLNRPVLKGSNKWDDTKFWEIRIEQLKQVINGKNFNYSLIGSSLLTLDGYGYDKGDDKK